MLGQYRVLIENAYVRYEFIIKRNITVIRGQSATGKTTLFEMVRSHQEQEESGISVQCDVPLVSVYGKDWERRISETTGAIIFLDEQSRFVKSKDFAKAVRHSDNYYVIISREKLSELPYSVDEIYGIRTRGKYAGFVGEFTTNEFYHIYGERPTSVFKPDAIIAEDSNSGYEFWREVCGKKRCFSAEGKTQVLGALRKLGVDGQKYLVIVDGAAFGAEMEEVMQYIKYANPAIEIFAPESFEYLILTSALCRRFGVEKQCKETYDYADSAKYFSWERFYTTLLTEVTKDTEMQYGKSRLNLYFISERNQKMILETLPENLLIQ